MAFADHVARLDRHAQQRLGESAPVTYRTASGVTALVFGIFDDSFVLTKGQAEAGVEARLPAVNLILADLPSDPLVDDPTLTIRGTIYRVVERRPADFGSIVLDLRKVV